MVEERASGNSSAAGKVLGTEPPTSSRRGFDVFLSYNSRDRQVVERIADGLKSSGLEPWLDRWALAPGSRWQEEIASGLASSSSCAVFIGPGEVGAWEREELQVARVRRPDRAEDRLALARQRVLGVDDELPRVAAPVPRMTSRDRDRRPYQCP
jgi:hypothetical protein